MSEEIFTASNQLSVAWRENEAGNKTLHTSWGSLTPLWVEVIGFSESSATNKALEEFYLHQNGLWRDPEAGALVIGIPKIDDRRGRAIRLIHEGLSSVYWETQKADNPVHGGIKDRYFAARPAPKPWQEAKLKEAWLLTVDGVEGVYVMDVDNEFNGTKADGHFMSYYRSYEGITAGKRIWPTEGESK